LAGRILIFGLIALACAISGCSDSGSGERASIPETTSETDSGQEPLRSRPRIVEALPPGEEAPAGPPEAPDIAEPEELPENEAKPEHVAATDDELLGELDSFARTAARTGGFALLQRDGTASPPIEAPPSVQRVVHAGNMISKSPYKWGGGHGRWLDSGYDCSGSVSFALFAAGLVDGPMTSGQYENWGEAGPGKWITIYANAGHMYMVVAGLRFDTSGRSSRLGSRWQPAMRSGSGFAVRHPPGL
jgi:cell wall-associated NlpC family hydrolase